jgi:23S rRNA pseudouridine955/2504/2580 synthase
MTALVKNIIGAKQGPAAAPNPSDPKAAGEAGAPHSAIKFLTVDAESAGQRLDNFLFRHLKGVPKTHVYRIIRSGEVRINKGRVQAETRIEAGDVLRLPPVRISARAEEGAKNPRRRANSRSCCSKTSPAGHRQAGRRGRARRQRRELRRDRATAQARPGAKFLELVHRLDRETSGILLVAKKRSRWSRCRTSSASARPARPTWRWSKAPGPPTRR